MSVRSSNWLKFGGLVGLAFVLGLLFAGLLDLPKNSLAQSQTQSPAPVQVVPAQAHEISAKARPLADLSEAFAAVAEAVQPSVVYIQSQRTERPADRERRLPPGFNEFFGTPRGRIQPQIERGSGSGFIVSADGYILTNNHVVDGADEVLVRLKDRHEFKAKVVGTDPNTDVAIIKIEPRNVRLQAAMLGTSATTRVGEWVLAVGNPLNEQLTFTVTSGIVSAKGRGRLALPGAERQTTIQDFLQTDAAINPGNSGGPLVNVRGEVIGINSAIASPTGYNAGYAFAIPIDLARQVMNQLITKGRVDRAALGVSVQDATAQDAEYVGLSEIRGVKIENFSMENSPAKLAGLQQGDIIVTIDGQPIEYMAQLQQLVGFKQPGEVVKVEVARRGGVRKTYPVRLVLQNEPKVVAKADSEPNEAETTGASTAVKSLGIKVFSVTTQVGQACRMTGAGARGLAIKEVDPYGPAEGLLVAGDDCPVDVITAAEGRAIRSEADLRAALADPGPGGIVSLTVHRFINGNQEGSRIVRIKLDR